MVRHTWPAGDAAPADPPAVVDAGGIRRPVLLATLAGGVYPITGLFSEASPAGELTQLAREQYPAVFGAGAGGWGIMQPGAEDVVGTLGADDALAMLVRGDLDLAQPIKVIWGDIPAASVPPGN